MAVPMGMHTYLGLCSMLKSIDVAQVPQAQWPQRMGSGLVNSHISVGLLAPGARGQGIS